jgi:hypothetical protein
MFELRMQWLNRLEKSSDEAIEINYDIGRCKACNVSSKDSNLYFCLSSSVSHSWIVTSSKV